MPLTKRVNFPREVSNNEDEKGIKSGSKLLLLNWLEMWTIIERIPEKGGT